MEERLPYAELDEAALGRGSETMAGEALNVFMGYGWLWLGDGDGLVAAVTGEDFHDGNEADPDNAEDD
jgi:hypothetical protein